MSNNMYEVIALIPSAVDFSLDKIAMCFGAFSYGNTRVRGELAKADGEDFFTGFRIWYDDWPIVAWLDEAPEVLIDSQEFVDEEPLPASREVIASCAERLCVWSDEDADGDHSDHMTSFTNVLRATFGLLIYDPVNGGWWT